MLYGLIYAYYHGRAINSVIITGLTYCTVNVIHG